MGAGEQHIAVELVDVDHVGVLIWVEFVGVLVCFIGGVVFVVEDEAVGVAAEDHVLEALDLVEDGEWALPQALGVAQLVWLWNNEAILLNHLQYIIQVADSANIVGRLIFYSLISCYIVT